VLLEPLDLNLRVAAGDALVLFTQPANVGATLPVEVGLSIPAEAQAALISVAFAGTKRLHNVGFCFVAVSLPRGMKSLFARQSIIPEVTTLEEKGGTFHFFSHFFHSTVKTRRK
jgi:hypothetical protein